MKGKGGVEIRMDVICLDYDGSVKQRYDEFIKFKCYKFFDASVVNYLSIHTKQYETAWSNLKNEKLAINKLEEAHRKFISSHFITT
ncbi:MAG: hypothetical protein NVSMB56_15460 [Pyrinomonadaceae bacterium]